MTLWTFNAGIPASNNDPSVDQPEMLNNNASTLGLIGTDHVTFNTQGPIGPPNGSGGQHLQVSFNGNNPPAVPTILPTLFANNQDGAGNALPGPLSQLFFYTGASNKSKDQYVSKPNGSVLLMGGIIMKWGLAAAAANNTTVVFPVSFPTACFVVIVSGGQVSGTQPTININTASEGPTGFTLKITGTTPVDVFYIAIGN